MAVVVYLLCTLTSSICAVLLLREYRRHWSRLVLWSGLSFTALAASNVLVFVEFVVLPHLDLALYRGALFWLATALLVYGLVQGTD